MIVGTTTSNEAVATPASTINSSVGLLDHHHSNVEIWIQKFANGGDGSTALNRA